MNQKLPLSTPDGQNRSNGQFGWLVAVMAVLMMLPIAVSAQISADTTARRMLQQGRVDEAISLIEKELVKRPRDGQLLLLKGAALSSADKKDEAVKVFRQMISDKIEEASAYNNLAVIYAGRGDYEAARLALEWAVRSKPDYGTAHHNLGNVYANLAALNYKQALELDDSDRSIPAKLSMLGDLMGEPAESMAESRPATSSRAGTIAKASTSYGGSSSRTQTARHGDSPQDERPSATNHRGIRSLSERQDDAGLRNTGHAESVYERLLLDRQNVAALHSGLATQPSAVRSEQSPQSSNQLPAVSAPAKSATTPTDRVSKAQAEPESAYAQMLTAAQAEHNRVPGTNGALAAPISAVPSRKQPSTMPATKTLAARADASSNRSSATTVETRSSADKREDYRNGNWVAGRLALPL